MSIPHHEFAEQMALQNRFLKQVRGEDARTWSDGRTGPNDDGDLAYAMANDDRHGVIRIRFPKPVTELGLDLKAATELRDSLTERIMAMRGVAMTAILLLVLSLCAQPARAEVLIVSSSRAATCHCGASCLCSPCTGNCSVVERLEAEFLAKHPGQKAWIKTGYNTTPEMAGAKSARIQATVSGESYSGVTEQYAGAAAAPRNPTGENRAAAPTLLDNAQRIRGANDQSGGLGLRNNAQVSQVGSVGGVLGNAAGAIGNVQDVSRNAHRSNDAVANTIHDGSGFNERHAQSLSDKVGFSYTAECRIVNGKRVCGPVQPVSQQAAKEPAGHWENYGLFGRKRRWVWDTPQVAQVQGQCANGRCK